MTVFSKEYKKCVLGYSDKQCKLELCDIGAEVDHATAFGRIAFSCPREEVRIAFSCPREEIRTARTYMVCVQ